MYGLNTMTLDELLDRAWGEVATGMDPVDAVYGIVPRFWDELIDVLKSDSMGVVDQAYQEMKASGALYGSSLYSDLSAVVEKVVLREVTKLLEEQKRKLSLVEDVK